MENKRILPGGAASEHYFFERKIVENSVVGFTFDGKYYQLAPNEELVDVMNTDGTGRTTHIRTYKPSGEIENEVPFKTWKDSRQK